MLEPFGMDDLSFLIPFRTGLFELLEAVIQTGIDRTLFGFSGVQGHNLVRLGQVCSIAIIVTQFIEVFRVIVVVLLESLEVSSA